MQKKCKCNLQMYLIVMYIMLPWQNINIKIWTFVHKFSQHHFARCKWNIAYFKSFAFHIFTVQLLAYSLYKIYVFLQSYSKALSYSILDSWKMYFLFMKNVFSIFLRKNFYCHILWIAKYAMFVIICVIFAF